MAKRRNNKVNRRSLIGKYTGYADPYRSSYTTDELLALRRKYAKAANQRLVRAGFKTKVPREGFKIGDSPALELLAKQGRRRFSEVKGIPAHLTKTDAKGKTVVDRNALKREISVLTGFLGSIRTTKEGRREIARQVGKTLDENFGVKLKPKELEYLLNNFNDFKSAVKMNSDALLQAIGEVSGDITNKDQIKQIIDELKDKKTQKEQSAAIYDAMYAGRKKAPARAEKVKAIRKAIRK